MVAQGRPGCGDRIRFAVISCLYSYICEEMLLDIHIIFSR